MSERLKRWQREEVPQISRAWVAENCHRVTERDLELGRLLTKRKLLRRDQIAILHPRYRNLANPEVQINRRLRTLFDCHFIDKAYPNVLPGCGSSQAVVALDRAGAMMLSVPYKRVIRHQKDRLGGITRVLPSDYRHTLGINDFEVSLVNWCLNRGAELIRWRLDYENMRRFQFNGNYAIRPDGFGIVRLSDGTGRAFFFEYDTGTEDERNRQRFKKLTAKFQAYAAYKRSGAWITEDWARRLREFPVLVFMTEDKRRIGPLREIAATLNLAIYVSLFSDRINVIKQLFYMPRTK